MTNYEYAGADMVHYDNYEYGPLLFYVHYDILLFYVSIDILLFYLCLRVGETRAKRTKKKLKNIAYLGQI